MKTFCKNYENPNQAGQVKTIRPEPGPVDASTVYVYVYCISSMYTLYLI